MKVKIVSVALLTGLLFACSSDDDEVVIDVTGDYTISTRSFTEFAANNVPCGDGEGTVAIADGTISGSVLSGEAQFNVSARSRITEPSNRVAVFNNRDLPNLAPD